MELRFDGLQILSWCFLASVDGQLLSFGLVGCRAKCGGWYDIKCLELFIVLFFFWDPNLDLHFSCDILVKEPFVIYFTEIVDLWGFPRPQDEAGSLFFDVIGKMFLRDLYIYIYM